MKVTQAVRYTLHVLRGSPLYSLGFSSACDVLPSSPIIGEPTIVGIITSLHTTQGGARVFVEEDPDVGEPSLLGGAKIRFDITSDSELFDFREEVVRRATVRDLAVRQWVEVVTRYIFDSYPQRGHADTLVIVR